MDFETAFAPFREVALRDARLEMTSAQRALICTHHLGTDLSDDDFPDVKTAFFVYGELDDAMLDAIDEYVLVGDEDLAERVAEGRLVPFAALNQSGESLAWGANVFAETRSWGLLCFDLDAADGEGCPVLWLRRGVLRPWSDGVPLTVTAL